MNRDFSDYDALTFDERDELDALADTATRTATTGLPPRPGVRR